MPTLRDFAVRPGVFISRYLVVLVIPGGVLLLPALAWWLDRRRSGIRAGPSARRSARGASPSGEK